MSSEVNPNRFTIACGQDLLCIEQALTDPQTYGLPRAIGVNVNNLLTLIGRALQALLNNAEFSLREEARGWLYGPSADNICPPGIIDSVIDNVLAPRIHQIFMHAYVPVQRVGVPGSVNFVVEPVGNAAKEMNHVREPEPGFCISWSLA